MGYGLEDGLEGLVAGVEEEVDVGVDETRHQGCGAEVDGLGSRGVGDVLADLGDAVAGDEDFAGGDELAGGDVEQVSGVEDCGFLSLLSGGGEGKQERGGEDLVSHRGKDTRYPLPPPFLRKVFSREGLGVDFCCSPGAKS